MAIGILGGMFDPPHLGHIAIAETARDLLALDKILWLPCGHPAHRPMPVSEASTRVHLCRLLCAEEPSFEVCTLEVERPGPHYMADTLALLRAQYPDESLVLILGIDAFSHLLSWHAYSQILTLAHLLVLSRPEPPALSNALKTFIKPYETTDHTLLQCSRFGHILYQPMREVQASSTMIRARLQANKPIDNLIPSSISGYIKDKGLYKGT